MESTHNNRPFVATIHELEMISAKAGLSEGQIMELLDSGLDIPELVHHLHAMLNNRMN
jgi:hypothetical protein